jgi:hypothetical protein
MISKTGQNDTSIFFDNNIKYNDYRLFESKIRALHSYCVNTYSIAMKLKSDMKELKNSVNEISDYTKQEICRIRSYANTTTLQNEQEFHRLKESTEYKYSTLKELINNLRKDIYAPGGSTYEQIAKHFEELKHLNDI